MKACKCDPSLGREKAAKGPSGICGKCSGFFGTVDPTEHELDRSQLVDAEIWLQAEIYIPKERIRAIHQDGKWYVYDGVNVHEFSEENFSKTYEKAAQSCSIRKINKKEKRYEYH